MTYPQYVPTSRTYSPGNWPVKATTMMDGFETRVLLGTKRFGAVLNLTYENIPDDEANEFLDHYNDMKGTFLTFVLGSGGAAGKQVKSGMSTALAENIPGEVGSEWRYAEQPGITSVYPGVSSVSVKLLQVLI